MTPDPDVPGNGHSGEDAELGPPITELRGVEWPVRDRFDVRVRGRIERRVLGGTFLELFWTAPVRMLLEFLRWPYDHSSDQSGSRKA